MAAPIPFLALISADFALPSATLGSDP
ncbi:MAG: hypothetical protein JWL57_1756, partial [Actinobacteria bacterium]|nr:hypothetical protein [Actinomycetota bacterium]